ncbi:MAG: aldehyde ferredoxin oxidoreductase C-terminal domain-containing protein [Candidatus Thorarchaeota archaeon]|jgi:aldehyde:ferredoxin oxidoreductase
MHGYMGKILRINLTTSTITEEFPDDETLRKYLGGSGLATKILFEETEPGIDPLGPENKLIFMTGPLTGTNSPSTGRYSVVTKAPLTNGWGQANSAGFWGRDFKRSGFDGVIFEGIAPKPVYLLTEDGKAELVDAEEIWGKNTSETTRILREKHGPKFNVACIGIGGENLVKYAAIMNDCDEENWGRAAGRCGVGAVMGSKNLKAIASKGTLKIPIADEETYRKEAKQRFDWVNQSILKMTLEVYGTATMVDLVNVKGGIPTRNWQTGVFENVEKINGTAINENILVKRKPCFACPIHCGRIAEIKAGPFKFKSKGEGPEYETISSFGTMCGVDNLEAITLAHFLCNEYGIDTISAGSTVGFAMECYQRGILKDEDVDGMDFSWGNAQLIVDIVHKIGNREGVGDLLAEGTKRISEKLGKGSEKFAMHVKGLELPGYDSRAAKVTGLAYAVANRGGDHITAYIEGPAFLAMPFMIVEDADIGDPLKEIPETALVVKNFEDALGNFDAIGGCKFMGMVLTADDWAKLMSSLMGFDITAEEFRKTGERIYNLQRAYILREGFTRADDTLPPRLLEDPLPEGPAEGQVVNLDVLLDAYYNYRGWDEQGRPTIEKLEELGLEWLIDIVHADTSAVEEVTKKATQQEIIPIKKSASVVESQEVIGERPWLNSYQIGPFKLDHSMAPYPEMNVYKFLEETAKEFPDNVACEYADQKMMYPELKEKVDKLATALVALGVKKGDTVATVLPSCPEFIIADYATMKIGAIHVPLSILHKSDDLMYELNESNAEILLCSYRRIERINQIKSETKVKTVIYAPTKLFPDYKYPDMDEIQDDGYYLMSDLIEKHEPHTENVEINPKEDIALLPFTGGTTGLPKGTMLTHYNITSNVRQTVHWMMDPLKEGIVGKSAGVICVPIFHAYGHWAIHACISWGLKMYLMDSRDIPKIVDVINKHRPFLVFAVPTHYTLFSKMDLIKGQIFYFSGAAALPEDLAEEFEEKSGVPMGEGYGATETSGVTTINISALSKVTGFIAETKRGVGIPIPETEIKIVDPDTGEELPIGERGEIWVRGPQIMKGYWPTPGSGLREGGWLPMGDIVEMDGDGYFKVVDRIKDMINVSGNKVYSRVIDDILFEHDAVDIAGVIGIPDPDRPGSERVKAFIQLKPEYKGKVSEQDIINFLKGKVKPYAMPKWVEFRDELPMTIVMKLFKKKLREEELAKFS